MAWLFDWMRSLRRDPMGPVTGHPDGDWLDLRIDGTGWLAGDAVTKVPSVRHSALSTREPIAIVWHYTATDEGTAQSLAKRIRTYDQVRDRAASWHVIVGRDGHLWQSVPFLRGAWHCARGTVAGIHWDGETAQWEASHDGKRHRVNACSVGIELEGHGGGFPWEQVAGATRLVRALVATYPIYPVHAMLGHADFDPARRSDPGPVWEALLPKLLRTAYGAELP